MIVNINKLQTETIQTIRGIVSEVEDDEFTLSDSSGSIEVDLDDDDLDDDDLDDLEDDIDLDNFLNEIDGEEVTVVGRLDDDDDDDVDDLEFEALRVTRNSGSLVFKDLVLEDAIDLGAENDNFVQNTPEAAIVNGGTGNDSLTGAVGDDFLIGGAGNDQLTGIAGFDTFLVGSGADIVTDFEPADVLDLGNSFEDIGQIIGDGGSATQIEQDTFIDLGNDNSVTLLNFDVEDLSPGNFAL